MALVNLGLANSNVAQGTNYHECVSIAIEGGSREDYTVVHISLIMEDGTTSRSTADQVNLVGGPELLAQKPNVHLLPWILVASDDDGWAVGIEEENGRVFWGLGQEVVLNREVDKWVLGAGNKNLDLVCLVGSSALESSIGARGDGDGGELGRLEGDGGASKRDEGDSETRHIDRIVALEWFSLRFGCEYWMSLVCSYGKLKLRTARRGAVHPGTCRDWLGPSARLDDGVEGQQRQRSSMAGVR